jgi:hypothetical protein
VHTLFLGVAYILMLRGSPEAHPLRRLWDDIAPATASCLGLVALALPVSLALTAVHPPAIVQLVAVALVAAPAYMLTLRVCFPATWRTQIAIIERIVPGFHRLPGVKPRPAAAGARSAA